MLYKFQLFFLVVCSSFFCNLRGEKTDSIAEEDYGFPKEGPARSAIVSIALKFARDHGLVLRTEGTGSSIIGDRPAIDAPWAILITSNQKMTLEKGVSLAQSLGEALMDTIDNDPAFITYYQKATGRFEKKDNCLAFRLAFWDEQMDRPLYPYMADIRLVNGEFQCSYADPKTQALQSPPIIKPFVYRKKD